MLPNRQPHVRRQTTNLLDLSHPRCLPHQYPETPMVRKSNPRQRTPQQLRKLRYPAPSRPNPRCSVPARPLEPPLHLRTNPPTQLQCQHMDLSRGCPKTQTRSCLHCCRQFPLLTATLSSHDPRRRPADSHSSQFPHPCSSTRSTNPPRNHSLRTHPTSCHHRFRSPIT